MNSGGGGAGTAFVGSYSTHGGHHDVGNYWRASGVLVECPFCGAPPFESCKPVDLQLPNGQRLIRVATYTGSNHAQRTYAGHAVLRRMLEASGQARLAADCPPEPDMTFDVVLELVEATVARMLMQVEESRPKRRPPVKRAPAKRSAK